MPFASPARDLTASLACALLTAACSLDPLTSPAAASSGAGGGAGASSSSSGGGAGAGGGGAGGGQGGFGGMTDGPNCNPAPPADIPKLELTEVVSGVNKPVLVTFAPGDKSRLFVLEREGGVRVVDGGVLLEAPFLDLTGIVSADEQKDQSFLGLAFHPDYQQNGRFFVNYTKLDSPGGNTTVLAEYQRSAGDPNLADPTPVKVLFEIDQGYVWHYGGSIVFGKDGFLYVSRGDGGSGGDPQNMAQNITVNLGKMLRIDVDTHPIPPPGNMPGAHPDVWSYGLRNPWRWSMDRCTGDIYIGDVGQGDIEEISVERAGQGHNNFGWDLYEGTACYEGACDPTGLLAPVAEFTHSQGCAVIGGHVYRGSAIPALRGTYLYGDICQKRVRTLVWEDGAVIAEGELTDDLETKTLLGDYSFSSFGEDYYGELYVCDMSGKVYRIDPE